MATQPTLIPGTLEAAIANANLDLSGSDLKSAAKEAEKVAAASDDEGSTKTKSSK